MRKQTRTITYNTYSEHENEIAERNGGALDNRLCLLSILSSDLGSLQFSPSKTKFQGEVFQSHDRIEVFAYKVEDNHVVLFCLWLAEATLKWSNGLMEQEIPEVYDGIKAEIMSVAKPRS